MAPLGVVTPEASLFGYRPSRLNSAALRCNDVHPQPCAVAATPPRKFRALNTFLSRGLTRRSGFAAVPRTTKRALVEAHAGHGPTPASTPPSIPADSILDDISRYFYSQVKNLLAPHLPKDFDLLAWLPGPIHDKVHNIEVPAVILLREVLHFAIFYALFKRVDTICKWMNWFYLINTDRKESADEFYKNSSFEAMAEPLRFLIVVWATTRLANILFPLLKLYLGHVSTAKIRAIGLIIAVTWFFFKWKALYIQRLVEAYRLDAPRIFAFDKVLSLLLYLVAASSIGEVTGFALRSLLAVGGFSGVALGLAAKEIVSNFFGGAVLFITRPFVIGERIKTGNISGYVQDIGFLQTKVLSQERVPMVVPNQNFINQVITNYSRASNKLMEAEFPIRMQDIFLVDSITSKVILYLKNHPEVDVNKSTPVCYLKDVNGSTNIIAVAAVLRPAGGSEFYRVQQSILVHIAEITLLEGAALGSNAPFGVSIPTVSTIEV